MEQNKRRTVYKTAQSIEIFQRLIDNKDSYFKAKRTKTLETFFDEKFGDIAEFNSVKYHIDNCRKAYRKTKIDLESTGNNDVSAEVYNSEELYNIIEQHENVFYPKGSNIRPYIMEPNSNVVESPTASGFKQSQAKRFADQSPIASEYKKSQEKKLIIENVVDMQNQLLREILDEIKGLRKDMARFRSLYEKPEEIKFLSDY